MFTRILFCGLFIAGLGEFAIAQSRFKSDAGSVTFDIENGRRRAFAAGFGSYAAEGKSGTAGIFMTCRQSKKPDWEVPMGAMMPHSPIASTKGQFIIQIGNDDLLPAFPPVIS